MCGKDAGGSSNQEGSRVFGVPLHQLAVGDCKVPIVVDRLITTIEIHGLYTEGIYRKSGVSISNIVSALPMITKIVKI
jgi:myosin-9